MKKHLSWIFALIPLSSLIADHSFEPTRLDPTLPWLTGPLIAPSGTVTPRGHYYIQPFFYFFVNTGFYNHRWHPHSIPNFYNVTLQLQAVVGITEWMDFQANPQAFYNHSKGESSTHFADLPLTLDFQLLSADKYEWFPGIKLGITETFPTGKYQKLSQKKLNTDSSGFGSFSTTVDLVFYKVYHLSGLHFLSMTLDLQSTFNTSVHVKGNNAYGGAPSTRGKVYPGTGYMAILSFEYTFNKNWTFAIDNVYQHLNKDHFSGHTGTLSSGNPATVGRHSSEQLSFAPAIEYNFNAQWGLIAGSWFSVAGRNVAEFRSGIFSFLYSY